MQQDVQIENIFDEDGFYEQGKSRDEFFIWALEEDGVMTVSGYERMADYGSAKRQTPPWYPYRDKIRCLIIDEGITELGVGAFRDCTSLETVMLPDSMVRLGYRCFDGCSSLKEIVLPHETHFSHIFEPEALRFFFTAGKKITMGLHCFRGTPWAKQQWGDFYIREGVLMDYFETDETVTIPEDIRCIYKLAFEKCGLTKVTFREGLETIRASAFDGNRIKEVHIPSTVTLMETGAFANNPLLIRMTTPAVHFTMQKNALHSTPIAAFYEQKRDALLQAESDKQEAAKLAAEQEGKKYKPGKLPNSILAVPEPRADMTTFPAAYRISASKLRSAPEFCALTLKETEQMLSAEEFLTGAAVLPRMKRGQVLVRVSGDVKKRELAEIGLLHYNKEAAGTDNEETVQEHGKKPKKRKPLEEVYTEHFFPFAEGKQISFSLLPAVTYFKSVNEFCTKVKASSGAVCMDKDTIADAPAGMTESWYLASFCDEHSLTQLVQHWLRTHSGYHAQSESAANSRRSAIEQ